MCTEYCWITDACDSEVVEQSTKRTCHKVSDRLCIINLPSDAVRIYVRVALLLIIIIMISVYH